MSKIGYLCFLSILTIVFTDQSNFKHDIRLELINPDVCGPYYCSNKKYACSKVKCSENEVEGHRPEICRCCVQCYKKLSEGDKCGDDDEALCDRGLICKENVCRKFEAQPL
ncbi:uncharacterized protein LOC114330561 isoform X3 [Diabrotica virgifera virgifera]|uniref:Uncharacterized protein n=1 Tax=Diabrotica virgifera virgifera TaxID=50390 RepID=A0ABM5JN71_DIAVI|nr:uncharacterized protein LOC114330561 isoform X3 [Diabrotica virgifera virgifera]